MIEKQKFEEFMKTYDISLEKKYCIKDDAYLDSEIESVSHILFDEKPKFEEVLVFWNPRAESYSHYLDSVLETYEDEWEKFCKDNNLKYDDRIEYYDSIE